MPLSLVRTADPTLPDEALACRIADGDTDALQVLMRRYNRTLFRTARSILHEDRDAEDAVKEAFYLAYRAMGTFRGEARLSTWLVRIVANEAKRRLRRRKRHSAVIVLMATQIPFHVFKTDNFVPTGEKLVVTASEPEHRIVREFNAEAAAQEYAASVGMAPDTLTPMSFASHPVVVKVGGEYYCRSIQKMNPDGSLSFFCAIDDGLVLSIAQPKGMVESTRAALKEVEARLGGIDMILGFDCVLRRLDARNRQVFRDISELYRANRVIGFGTYGEQYRSMHLNQTFTGIAFGHRQAAE